MSDVVAKYYDTYAEGEWQRLENPYTKVEFECTKFLIQKYFPKKGKIVDIGAGPGRYSLYLLQEGYEVTLSDLSKEELQLAQQRIEEQGLKAEGYICKSALDLDDLPSETFDGILLMGPLYHLHTPGERNKVLSHVKRALKPSGICLVAYINSWGCLKASVREFPESFEDSTHFERYLNGNLQFSHEESFTRTFFTTPPLALKEVQDAGFEIISYAGAESFLAGLGTDLKALREKYPLIYNNYIEQAKLCCELPQYRDATEHLHIVIKKNTISLGA